MCRFLIVLTLQMNLNSEGSYCFNCAFCFLEPFRNVSRCFLNSWSWLESAPWRDVSAFQHREHHSLFWYNLSVARFILALSHSLFNFPVAGSKQDQLRLEGINRFECARDRHRFCSSTRFRKLAPLLQALTRVTKVGFWKCRRVHQNWTSKYDSPSYKREMILLIDWRTESIQIVLLTEGICWYSLGNFRLLFTH